MKSAVSLLLACAALAAALPSLEDLEQYTYDDFLRDFPGAHSRSGARQAIFESRLREIRAHNANPSRSYSMGVNHMSDWTADEFRGLLGSRVRHLGRLNAASGVFSASSSLEDLPRKMDWRTQGVVTPVKDQGHCGSCWAFSSTANLESHLAISTGVLMELSPQQLVSCSENKDDCGGYGGCEGSIAELAYDYVKKNGMTTPYHLGYGSWAGGNGTCPKPEERPAAMNVTGYMDVQSNNLTAVLEAIATKGPLTVNVAAMPWQSYSKGVFDGCDTKGAGTDIDHVVQAVGYDLDANPPYLLIRNSWTPLWGENGYIRLRIYPGEEHCGTDEAPSDGTGCNGGPSTQHVCGECGVLFSTSYPTGARLA